ncbi:hypothetical protein [Tsukamurella conjunctivitidis]|uniref:hypothetical protein n=1 Tax=Tsukamurella conjunctivitidis TaxID=2592068 RepID=UPI001315382F|nr:hypothetical protein [Tsukamurella conjunctivitidis]
MRLTGMDLVAEMLHDYYVATLGDGVRDDDGDARIVAAIRGASGVPAGGCGFDG